MLSKCGGDGFDSICDTEFFEDDGSVVADNRRTDAELLCNVGVRLAVYDTPEDDGLTRRKGVCRWIVGKLPLDGGGNELRGFGKGSA